MQCLTEGEVAQFLSEDFPSPRLEQIARHIESCESCCDLVRIAKSDDRLFNAMQVAIQIPVGSSAEDNRTETAGNLPTISGYQTTSIIDQGGQGTVYLAEQTATKRSVAIKILHGWQRSVKQRTRFEREIELVSGLKHPNIVTVYECGESNGQLYLPLDGAMVISPIAVPTICSTFRSVHDRFLLWRSPSASALTAIKSR